MPKKIDIEKQRKMITNAAITVINETGLEGTRLRDVARAGNVTTGAVTHYFDGKEAVLDSALEEIVRRTLERIQRPIDPDMSWDVPAFIRRVCYYLPVDDDGRQEWRVWLAFWGRAIADDRLRTIHQNYYKQFVEGLARHLHMLRPSTQQASNEEACNCADALLAAIDGIGTRATLEPKNWPVARQRETLTYLITPMLLNFSTVTQNKRNPDV